MGTFSSLRELEFFVYHAVYSNVPCLIYAEIQTAISSKSFASIHHDDMVAEACLCLHVFWACRRRCLQGKCCLFKRRIEVAPLLPTKRASWRAPSAITSDLPRFQVERTCPSLILGELFGNIVEFGTRLQLRKGLLLLCMLFALRAVRDFGRSPSTFRPTDQNVAHIYVLRALDLRAFVILFRFSFAFPLRSSSFVCTFALRRHRGRGSGCVVELSSYCSNRGAVWRRCCCPTSARPCCIRQ
jgi:hypothetical protein